MDVLIDQIIVDKVLARIGLGQGADEGDGAGRRGQSFEGLLTFGVEANCVVLLFEGLVNGLGWPAFHSYLLKQ